MEEFDHYLPHHRRCTNVRIFFYSQSLISDLLSGRMKWDHRHAIIPSTGFSSTENVHIICDKFYFLAILHGYGHTQVLSMSGPAVMFSMSFLSTTFGNGLSSIFTPYGSQVDHVHFPNKAKVSVWVCLVCYLTACWPWKQRQTFPIKSVGWTRSPVITNHTFLSSFSPHNPISWLKLNHMEMTVHE